MSNVTAAEIAALAAAEFGLTLAALRAPHTAGGSSPARRSGAQRAWLTAAALIGRHTRASLAEAGRALGRRKGHTLRHALAGAATWLAMTAPGDAALAAAVAHIEDAIDALHEQRAEAESATRQTGPGAVAEGVALGNEEGRP